MGTMNQATKLMSVFMLAALPNRRNCYRPTSRGRPTPQSTPQLRPRAVVAQSYRHAAGKVCHREVGREHAGEGDISKSPVIEHDATGTDDDRQRC